MELCNVVLPDSRFAVTIMHPSGTDCAIYHHCSPSCTADKIGSGSWHRLRAYQWIFCKLSTKLQLLQFSISFAKYFVSLFFCSIILSSVLNKCQGFLPTLHMNLLHFWHLLTLQENAIEWSARLVQMSPYPISGNPTISGVWNDSKCSTTFLVL